MVKKNNLLVMFGCTILYLFVLFWTIFSHRGFVYFTQDHDFAIFYQSATALKTGNDPYGWAVVYPKKKENGEIVYHKTLPKGYQPTNEVTTIKLQNLNTPFTLSLLVPFTLLPMNKATLYFIDLSVLMTLAALLIIARRLNLFALENRTTFVLGTSALLICSPLDLSLRSGQLGCLVFLLGTILWGIGQKDINNPWFAFWTGLATAIKLFFGLFGLLLLVKNTKQFILFCVSFILFSASPLLFYPKTIFHSFMTTVISDSGFLNIKHIYKLTSPWNGSIMSTAYKFLSTELPSHYPTVALAYLISGVSCLYLLFMYLRNILKTTKPRDLDSEYYISLTILCIFLLLPLSWQYYYIILLLPIITGAKQYLRKSLPIIPILLTISIFFLNLDRPFLIPPNISALHKSVVYQYGNFIAMLSLLAALLLGRTQYQPYLFKIQNISIQKRQIQLFFAFTIGSIPSIYTQGYRLLSIIKP